MYLETNWNSSVPKNMKEAVSLLETVLVDLFDILKPSEQAEVKDALIQVRDGLRELGGRLHCGKQERNLKGGQKVIWQFGTLSNTADAMEVLQGTLHYVNETLSNSGLEQRQDIQPILCRLQECVSALKHQVESDSQGKVNSNTYAASR